MHQVLCDSVCALFYDDSMGWGLNMKSFSLWHFLEAIKMRSDGGKGKEKEITS